MLKKEEMIVLENFEGDGEAAPVSLKALIGDKKPLKEKKEEECCGKHKNCKHTSNDACSICGIKKG